MTKCNAIAIIVLSIALLIGCNEPKYFRNGEDPFPEITLPVYLSPNDVTFVINSPHGAKSVQYSLKMMWPALEIAHFYDKELKRMGYTHYMDDGYGGAEWSGFIDGTKEGSPSVGQYIKTWVDDKHERRILLALRNYNEAEDVKVIFQVNRFFDFTELNEFDAKLEKQDKSAEFYKFLSKYEDDKHTVDLDRALSENPDNELLKEYVNILSK